MSIIVNLAEKSQGKPAKLIFPDPISSPNRKPKNKNKTIKNWGISQRKNSEGSARILLCYTNRLLWSTSWINKNETKTKRLLQDMSSSCSRSGSHSGSHSRSHGNLFHRVGCPFVCALECYRCRPWESNARRGSAIGVTGSGPGPAAQVCKSQICLLWEFVGGVWLGKVFECECVLCGGNSLSSFCLVWILLKLWKLWAVRLRVIRKSKGVT